jgi:hypothetical protein
VIVLPPLGYLLWFTQSDKPREANDIAMSAVKVDEKE